MSFQTSLLSLDIFQIALGILQSNLFRTASIHSFHLLKYALTVGTSGLSSDATMCTPSLQT